MLQHCIVCTYEKYFKFIQNFLYIINDRHSDVMCAKYGGSRMNNVHTICPANFVSLPAKVVWPTTFFSKKKVIFVWLLCQLSASRPGSQLMNHV